MNWWGFHIEYDDGVLKISRVHISQNEFLGGGLPGERVPQSHLYSLVSQTLEWDFRSDWTAYLLEHLSHFHFFFLQNCFLIPVKSLIEPLMGHAAHILARGTQTPSSSPLCLSSAWAFMAGCALVYAAAGSGLFGTLCQISHTNLLVANNDFVDKALNSTSGSWDWFRWEKYCF